MDRSISSAEFSDKEASEPAIPKDLAKAARHGRRIAVIGLGYVGLSVAAAFARSGMMTVGFDISPQRIRELRTGHDRTQELSAEELRAASIELSDRAEALRSADFFIVTVPTPIDEARQPDMRSLIAASRIVGEVLSRGAIVVYESTVYPGATEEECVPVLETASGMKCGRDFHVGYSPERANPGDRMHRFESIKKVVSAMDENTLNIIADVYSSVIKAGVFRASSIKVAEAAKVIENSQRDINVAFMNELSEICHQLDINTDEVLAAASTKWNFLQFSPGLVGGHCTGVDPYYLIYCALRAGYHPEITMAGRRINEGVSRRIARECVRLLAGEGTANPHVIVLGCTFKEDVPDLRNSKVVDLVNELKRFSVSVQVADPLADSAEAESECGFSIAPENDLRPADAVILAVPHAAYIDRGWRLVARFLKPNARTVLDVKGRLPQRDKPEDLKVWRL